MRRLALLAVALLAFAGLFGVVALLSSAPQGGLGAQSGATDSATPAHYDPMLSNAPIRLTLAP